MKITQLKNVNHFLCQTGNTFFLKSAMYKNNKITLNIQKTQKIHNYFVLFYW